MNDDDITEQAGKNRIRNGEVEQEFLVKWQLPGTADHQAAKNQLHQLLSELLASFPNKIVMIDRKQREWIFQESDDAERFEKEIETASVQLHPIKNGQKQIARWVSIIKFRSELLSHKWKDNDYFYNTINDAGAYLFPHPFGEDEWDIVSIGFIKDIHVVHFPKDLLHDHINHLIKQQEKSPPAFQLIPQRITTIDKKATTKAFTVQCMKKDATQLIQLLTHGSFRNPPNQIFVPFKYKKNKPDLFLKCIRQQNEVYYKTWIIKLEGIAPEAMAYMEQAILSTRGVLHVVPSKRMEEIGEWKVLTDHTKCAYVYRQLKDNWGKIINAIPVEILQNAPRAFSIPKISSKEARDYQDADSEDDSYGSLLTTGTDISVMTTDETSYNELPEEFQYATYAAATVGGSNTTTASHTQMSSPTVSTQSEWQREKQELEALIQSQAQQIEKIQADIEAKISRSKDLEEKLAKAIDLAHSRDARLEEMLEKFDQLMSQHPVGGYNTAGYDPSGYAAFGHQNPSTPERAQPTAAPPPTKKANTNSSPNRTIYALFRQTNNRQTPARTNTHNRNQLMLHSTQSTNNTSMDVDEDNRQPTPGAKTGQKKE